MSMTKWTPGKWFVGPRLSNGELAVIGDEDSVVCLFTDRIGGVEEDANLIAAAPSLYEALKLLCDTLNRNGYSTAHANAVLARARGESHE